MPRQPGVALALVPVLVLLASPARAQELEALIGRLGDGICALDSVPESDRRLLAAERESRIRLYLRCTLKGRDEFVRTACCEHLSTEDRRAMGLCPASPGTEAVLRGLRDRVRC